MDHFNVSYMNDTRIFNAGRLTRIYFDSHYFTVLIKLKKCVERVLKK